MRTNNNEDMRENIFTQFADSIVAFSEHRITREQLYNNFVSMVELADENEKTARKRFQKEISNVDFTDKSEWEINTYNLGLQILSK